ncbi:hypothetical protein BJY52DRAFT_1255763 [Lactarius psammicola]|nr:hypothetical protein BJY52DRAFT_1255763 [Lactarius psammicola]
MTMSLSSMITLPSSSANGLYSSWRAYPEIASPTTSDDGFSPPGSPPSSSSLMMTLPGGPANGFYPSWTRNHYADITSPAGSGSLSPSMSRSSSPPYTINQVLSQRASWPVTRPFSEQPREQPDSEGDNSRPTSMTTSVSFSYTVRSVNSRKSRMMVLYPRPVRPKRASCVEVIAESESAGLSTESLVPLSSRPVSLSNPPQWNRRSIMDKQYAAEVMTTLSALFDSSPENPLTPIERRLTASWKSLTKINAYEEKNNRTPSFRATRIYADTLLCVHNDIVESDSVGVQDLARPCVRLNEAFEDAYTLLSDPSAIPQVSAQISALDADLFRNFVVSIMQLINLIRALEVLVDSLAILAVVRTPSPAHKADPDDDVIFNVPGWRERRESRPTLPSTAPGAPEAATDSALRLLLVTRHEELEWELRGLRFLIWRANPKAKAELGNIVKRVLPLHHAELMRCPVEDFVGHWQAAVVTSGHWSDERTSDGYDTDPWWVSDR